jgi:uncharacterized protein (DUF1697 family)
MATRRSRMVALLRGINVGKAKRVAMADLKALVADLGYDDVVTILNSGNVVFTGSGTKAAAAAAIAKGLEERLQVTASVMVVAAKDLAAAVAENPLGAVATDPSRLLVAFCAQRSDLARFAPLAAEDWRPEALAIGAHAAYLWCAGGIHESPLAAAVGRALGDRVTARNWTTVLKLQALLNPAV